MSSTTTLARIRSLQHTRSVVPWKTVAALAVVLAYADGFWLTSLRGAVGAIQRTQSPFASWLQESTVVLPVFVVAVLGALTLAVRWFGPELHRPRSLVATALMIVAAATVVGIAETVVSAVYDYHLQAAQLQMMGSMETMTQHALAQQQDATRAVHIHGVIYIGRWLLLTNALLVGWIVAMCGGRLKLSTGGPATGASTDAARDTTSSRAMDTRLLLIGALITSALIHAAVAPGRVSAWSAAGMFFLLLAIWELAVAGMLLARLHERVMLLAAAAVSIVPLAVWLWSRTAGLPFAPDASAAEWLGLPELAAGALGVAALSAAVALLHRGGRSRRPPVSAHVRSLVVATLIAVTVIGLAGVGLGWFDPFGVGDVQTVMNMAH